MSIPLTINGAVFEYPVDFDENWGVDATGWAQAVTNGMLQMAGGSFPLTADINFGPNFGLLSKYFETRSANPATTGTVRLSSADAGIAWRNFTNSGNNILTTDASNNLQYNGSTISGGVNAVPTIQRFLSGSGTYTTPTSPRTPLYLKVTLVGPGGGGGGGGTNANAGSAGSGATTFAAGSASAGPGTGGLVGTSGGTGGTNALSTSATIIAIQGIAGSNGGASNYTLTSGVSTSVAGQGGSTPLGAGGPPAGNSGPGGTGRTNTGEGGAGGGSGVTGGSNFGGTGGGGGGYLQFIVTSPSATYAYSIGTGGAGGTSTAGGGGTGGAGASGQITVEEYYQ